MSGNMGIGRKLLWFLWGGLAVTAWGQTTKPQIGYLFPAGGQRGTSFEVIVGGQVLRQATEVYVSGEGVTAEIVRYIRPLRNLNGDQRKLLQNRLKELRDLHLAKLDGNKRGRSGAGKRSLPLKLKN